MFDINTFAGNIRRFRKERDLRQYELAQRLGVTAQSVSKWEQALAVPEIGKLCAMAAIFGVSTDELLGVRKTGRNLIAIDGGGSKTEFLLFTEEGRLVKRAVLEGCNPNICGMEKTKAILTAGVRKLLGEDEPDAIFCGMAGILTGNNMDIIGDFLRESFPRAVRDLGSDILNVAASGTDSEGAIAAICGTGSNVSVIKGRQLHRVGGWGYLFDGAGSGYDIGRDGITAALAENDGIGPKTLMTELIEKRLGGNIWDNIGRLYAEDKGFIASFSAEVFTAYRSGDELAIRIIEKNAEALTDKINFASEKYGQTGPVVLSGGIISHNPDFCQLLEASLNHGLQAIIPEHPPIYGACRLCGKLLEMDLEALAHNFPSDYERLCKNA